LPPFLFNIGIGHNNKNSSIYPHATAQKPKATPSTFVSIVTQWICIKLNKSIFEASVLPLISQLLMFNGIIFLVV